MRRTLALVLACVFAGVLLAMGIGQEIPVGGLAGKVTLAENGHPMPHALVVLTVHHPNDEYDWVQTNWHVRTDGNGEFSIRSIPAGDYDLDVVAHEHRVEDASVAIVQGRQAQLEVHLKPNDPHLQLYASKKVVAPDKPVNLEISGFVPSATQVQLEVRKLRPDVMASKGGLRQALEPLASYNENAKQPDELAKLSDPVSSQSVSLNERNAEGAFNQKLTLPPASEGLYLVACSAGKLDSKALLNVTNLALVTKSDGTTAHCYVADIDSGKPVAGATLSEAISGHIQTVGQTDTRGMAVLRVPQASDASGIIARSGKSLALCELRQGRGSSDGEESDDSDEPADANTRIFTYVERPIYRPGDTVQFKAIVRHLQGDELKLPGSGTAKVKFFDPDDDLLSVQELPISGHGTIHGSVSTNSEAAPGVYRIEVHAHGGVDKYSVNLAAYRKPDYSIKVTPDKPRFSMGDTASATVECQYFFGGPVVGAKIRASIYRSPAWDYSSEDDSDDEAASDGGGDDSSFVGGEYVQDVKVVTDGTGKAVISFPTTPDQSKDNQEVYGLYDYRYSIQASVEDAGGKSFDGSGSVLVTQGDLILRAETDPYIVSPGDKANLTITTSSQDPGHPPVANQPVQIEIGEQNWSRHTEVFESLQKLTVTTGADGKAVVPLNIGRAANLSIRTRTADAKGREVRDETSLWVEGGYSEPGEGESLKVRLDRKHYDTGDTLKAMITTGDPGGTAFVTIQSDTVKLVRAVPLSSSSTMVKLKVDRSMFPNAYLHIAYVRNRDFEETQKMVRVARPDKALKVTVQPDRPKALPGTTVAFRIRTCDKAGQGVPAEVSLGVVDESIYTIRKDDTDIRTGLYPQVSDLVTTAYSFPEIYLDGGDKAGGSVPVRRKFLDTASWSPVVETDRSGQAMVSVRLPDNLTSWRATVVGSTDDTAVGMGTTNVRASKPLMVRLETPQFMVATDKQQIAAAVTNDSGNDLDVDFSVTATGLTLADGSSQRLHIANQQTVSVPLDVTAPSTGTGSLVATVRAASGPSDAVEGKFPILPHGRLVVDDKSGTVSHETDVPLTALPNRDLSAGSLTLTVSPSALTAVLQSLDGLVQYPYGCVEQTMSRFLPAVQVTHALKGTRWEKPDLDRKAAKIAQDGFARLRKMQHEDGAWGWWVFDSSDPLMTGWVLDGLKRAEAAGYPTPPYLHVDKALDWAAKRLQSPLKGDTLSSRLFLAYALAEYSQIDQARATLRSSDLSRAGTGELALAALGAQAVGDGALRDGCLDRMKARLDRSEAGVDPRYEGIWDVDEHLALALLAITELRPNDPEIVPLIRRLLDRRRCDGWEDTRATALAVSAMCDYLGRSMQATEASDLSIELNGTELRRVHVDPAAADSPDLRLELPVSQLKNGENHLTLRATGGAPFYSVELRQYDDEPELGRVIDGSGLSVERRYYRMEPRQNKEGVLELMPSDQPISSVKSGDIVKCEITLRCDHPLDFLMVEDPLPSNFRVTDREDPGDDEEWGYWWSSLVIRDDRVSLFSRQMDAGKHTLTYMMRAEDAGTVTALPTRAENMYRPDEVSSGDALVLEVTP